MHRCINIRRSGSDTALHHHLCNRAINITLSHNTRTRLCYSFGIQRIALEMASELTPRSDPETVAAIKKRAAFLEKENV